MEDLVDILVPLGVCVALPVLIVWLTTRSKIIADKLRAQIILEAIRNNPNVDPKELAEMFKPATKSEKEILRSFVELCYEKLNFREKLEFWQKAIEQSGNVKNMSAREYRYV